MNDIDQDESLSSRPGHGPATPLSISNLALFLAPLVMASETDYQIASLAAGFTLGFGFLTVWEAMKQTRRNRNPLRSVYIYMLWGEIVANLVIAVVGWLFLEGILGPT